jgi:hypothetical protein
MPRCGGKSWYEEGEEPRDAEYTLNASKYDREKEDNKNAYWFPNRALQREVVYFRTGEVMTATDEKTGEVFNLRWDKKAHVDLIKMRTLNCMCVETKDPMRYVFNSRNEMKREMLKWDPNTTFASDEEY